MKWFLVIVILFGIAVRFYFPTSYLIEPYESDIAISGLKMHHQNFTNGMRYSTVHPPVGEFFSGLFTYSNPPYNDLIRYYAPDDPPLRTFVYFLHEPLTKNYTNMRLMSALFGALSIAFFFLIGRKIFGFAAGLFSAALASISVDMLIFSRVVTNEIYMIFFMIATIYFYIRYLEFSGRKKYMFLTLVFFFLLFALGSRILQPLFLIPVLVISQLIFKWRYKKEILLISLIIALAYFLMFGVIYKPNAEAFSWVFSSLLKINSPLDVLGNSLPRLLEDMIYRNSYISVLAIVSIIFVAIGFLVKNKFVGLWKILHNKGAAVISILFITFFFALGFSKYGDPEKFPVLKDLLVYASRYSIIIFIPLFALGGFALEKISSRKLISVLILLIIAFDVYSIFSLLPDHLYKYSNFGDEKHRAFGGFWNEYYEKSAEYLNSVGSPPIVSNQINVLEFYKSNSDMHNIDLIRNTDVSNPENTDPHCTVEVMSLLYKFKPYIVYERSSNEFDNMIYDPNVCFLFRELNISEVFKTEEIKIYKIDDFVYTEIPESQIAPLINFLNESGNPKFLINDKDVVVPIYKYYRSLNSSFVPEGMDCRNSEKIKEFLIIYIAETNESIMNDEDLKSRCPKLLELKIEEIKNLTIGGKNIFVYKTN